MPISMPISMPSASYRSDGEGLGPGLVPNNIRETSSNLPTAARSQAADLTVNDLASDDVLIVVMGPTGSGKSTIVDTLTDRSKKRAGSGLASCTQEICATRLLNHPTYRDRIVLIDTPGFDDTKRSDLQVLEMVEEWLKKIYEQEVEIAGIFYLRRIQRARLTGAHNLNFRIFSKMCGKKATSKVLLTTTTWDVARTAIAEDRENELRQTLWKDMIESGAKVGRFHNNKASAEALVNEVLKERTEEMILLQKELCLWNQSLNETSAGRVIFSKIQTLVHEKRKSIVALTAEDNGDRQDLHKQIKKMQSDLDQTIQQMDKLRVSFPQKIMAFLSLRKFKRD